MEKQNNNEVVKHEILRYAQLAAKLAENRDDAELLEQITQLEKQLGMSPEEIMAEAIKFSNV